MRIVTLEELGENPRQTMAGARWLVLKGSQVAQSTALLMFTELDDILVAVDHRGVAPQPGLWQRAVHCIMIDGTAEDAEAFRRTSGITKVIAQSDEAIETHLW
jgi:hypothetical protein